MKLNNKNMAKKVIKKKVAKKGKKK